MQARNELKKALIGAGFEVYRTFPNRIVLADRVRDNLIMDSGVSAGFEPTLTARFVVRAMRSDFLGEDDGALFNRARQLAGMATARGYSEAAAEVVPVPDPGDKTQTLDTWFEVAYERPVTSLEELFAELRQAMAMEKVATPPRAG